MVYLLGDQGGGEEAKEGDGAVLVDDAGGVDDGASLWLVVWSLVQFIL